VGGLRYAPALLCLVGLLLSLEYRGEKHRAPLRVFQALSLLALAASAVGWFVALPAWASYTAGIAAIVVNLPLAGLGMMKHKK